MEKFEFTADPNTYESKPSKQQAAHINNSLRPADVSTIEDFIEGIEQGISWSPSLFEANRSNDSWVGQCIAAMDFDGGITPSEAIERIQAYDITPNAFYPTFGDSPQKRKFRLIFFLDRLITNREARDYLMDGLFKLYPEADEACKNPAHFFYGTNKKGKVLNHQAISLDLLFSVLESDKIKNRGRMYKVKADSKGAKYLRGICAEQSSYSNYIEKLESSKNLEEKKEAIEKLRDNRNNKAVDWDKLQQRVRIFYDFMNSKQRLTYKQLLGLAQNLVWMKGGKRIFEERLEEFNKNHTGSNPYPRDGRFELIRSLQKYNRTIEGAYFPQRLENFSPYKSDHQYHNLLQAERELISGVEQLEPINKIPLSKAENMLQYKLNQALDTLQDKIFIFRLATSVGKTWRIKDLENVTLAFPTNDLKEEIYHEREDMTKGVMTPEIPHFEDEDLNKKIEKLYSVGLGKKAYKLLWDIRLGRYGASDEDRHKAEKYLEHNEAAKDTFESVYTTHSRALRTPYKHETIIFDEDPLELILNVGTIKIADLKKIEKTANMFGSRHLTILDLQRYLEQVDVEEIHAFPSRFDEGLSEHTINSMALRDIDSNVIKFLNCQYFYKDPADRDKIHYITKNPIPENKKILIMSATIPVDIYQKMYGERVEVIDISDVANKGSIRQHTNYSYSRNSLANRLEEANAKTKDRPTITFKTFKDSITSASDQMHFGNCSGYNSYTGVDINVLGTPHKHNAQYYLIGKALGINVDKYNREFKMQTVTRNGFKFPFNTFTNNDLRDIQLSLIESELIQAAGRARALREEVEVDIYSNLPLRISDEIIKD